MSFSAGSSEVSQVATLEASLDLSRDKVNFAEVGQWNFSIGIGLGNRSNPLIDGEDTPLYIIPSLSYYGEHVYYDDGVLGYSYEITPQLYVSAITQLNAHAGNFSQWHPTNFLVPTTSEPTNNSMLSNTYPLSPKEVADTPVSVALLSKRNWALDAGAQINYFTPQDIMLQFNLLTDVSGVYNGFNAQLKIEKTWGFSQIQPLSVKLSTSLDWYSEKLANYYYGISYLDNNEIASYYYPSSGRNITVGLTANYQFNSQWRAVLTYRRTTLGESIARSRMVRHSKSKTFFIGAMYNF